MRFLRHILSHLIFIIVITGIATVYYFRNQVLPEGYVQKIDLYAGKIHPGLVSLASPLPANKTPVKLIDETEVAEVNNKPVVAPVTAEKAIVNTEENIVEEAQIELETTENVAVEVVDPVSEINSEVKVVEVEIATEDNKESVAAKSVEDTKPVVVAENFEANVNEVKQADNKKIVEEPVASTDKEAADYKMILTAARTAFSNGDVKLSIKKYNELVELENHEADFFGELGNVYYAAGNWQQAGASYYEAAVRLIDKGQLAQVGYLQKVIQGLDTERAEKLAKQLASKKQ